MKCIFILVIQNFGFDPTGQTYVFSACVNSVLQLIFMARLKAPIDKRNEQMILRILGCKQTFLSLAEGCEFEPRL